MWRTVMIFAAVLLGVLIVFGGSVMRPLVFFAFAMLVVAWVAVRRDRRRAQR